ncbi:MAG: hypothetical protein GXO83_08215 [Chlorobi bacterium]|nr:hypothetical protein [Chlorobiota bacterium]
MKKTFLLIYVLLFSVIVSAQAPFPTPGQIEKFMNSKTLVVLEEGMFSTFNALIKKAMEQNWTITPYEFIDYDTFKEKKSDAAYSFIILTETGFENDKANIHYDFLNLLLGDNVNNMSKMPEFCSFPLNYTKVEDPCYPVMLPLILKFMQEHVKLMSSLSNPKPLRNLRYYNKNIPHVRNYPLWLAREDLTKEVDSEKKIEQLYKHPVKVVSRDELVEAIANPPEPFIFLFKVGPEGTAKSGRVYKILMGTNGKIYFFDFHLLSAKRPDGMLLSDFKRLGKY